MTAPVPYPPETRARGWRFEVDMEAVKASETWLRARRGDVRGALLLLWSEAWQQTPCGTIPNDDELIALLLDMDAKVFARHRAVLLRGWWLAEDGRLYHEVITQRVRAMLAKRENDAQRAANRRARQAEAAAPPPDIPDIPPEVTDASRVTHGGVEPEFDTKHQAPSTSPSSSAAPKKKAPKPAAWALPDWVPAEQWGHFVEHRRSMRGVPFTDAARDGVVRELEKLMGQGHKPGELLATAVTRGWRTVFAPRPDALSAAAGETAYQRSQRETVAQFTGGLVSKKAPVSNIRPMETIDATTAAARLG